MAKQAFNFMAVYNINGPDGQGWGRTPVTINAPITAQVWAELEQAIRDNSRGLQIPATASLVLTNLIPLEG